MKQILFGFFCWIVTVTIVNAASFDCAKASTKVEKLICSDSELSKLDEDLSKAYQQSLERSDVKKGATVSQRQWLKNERNICQNAECIKTAYERRIKELGFTSSFGIVFMRPPENREAAGKHAATLQPLPPNLSTNQPINRTKELSNQISPNEAAAIKSNNAKTKIEKLFSSAPVLSSLDRELSDVYLEANELGNHEKSQLLWRRDIRDHCDTFYCLKGAYESRINALRWIAAYQRKIPKNSLVRALCEKLSVEASRRQILSERQGIEDINNDGQPETVAQCDGGSMRTSCSEYSDNSGKKIEIEQLGFEGIDDSYGQQAFRYGGKTYILNSEDDSLLEPSYLSYITPANKEHILCEFSNYITSAIDYQDSDSNGLCQDAMNNQNIEDIELQDLPKEQKRHLVRSETIATKTGLVDINNDGALENVYEFIYTSGGGRGCDYNYYELMDDSGKEFKTGATRTVFLKMQGIDNSGFGGRSCGHVENKLFRFKGKAYFEQNVGNNESFDHLISIQNGNDVKVVCKYKRVIETELKNVTVDIPDFNDED
jgi:uncharacterized protein